jgi:dihydrolipoamide dehydrogenase
MSKYDVIIIGGGPGGYAAAVQASKSGLKTALVEKELIGGTCVNWGCIPTKALLKYAKLKHLRSLQKTDADFSCNIPIEYHDAHDKSFKISKERRKCIETLLKDCQVALFTGNTHLISKEEVEIRPSGQRLFGKNIIIATGSKPRQIPGVEYDGVNIVTTREALQFSKAPSSAVIVGSGATGMEFATVWNSFGSKVTVLEMMPNILAIGDSDISTAAEAYFRNAGLQIRTGVKVESIVNTADGVEVIFSSGGTKEKMIFEKALIAAGITPNSADLGLEELNVETDRGYIKIDNQMRTNLPGIYAIGDVTGKLALAFSATAQGIIAAEAIAGHKTKDPAYENIPRCIFSDIEVASVGLTEKQARERGYDVVTVKNPIVPYAKVVTFNESGGFIKLVADAKSKKVLGVFMIGSDVTDQIAGPARMISLGSTVPEIINVVCNGR